MIELTKFVRRLGKTAPLGDIIGAAPDQPYITVADQCLAALSFSAREHNPGPEVQTDEELIAWIKQYTNSIARMCSIQFSLIPCIFGVR
jgi:hypothetical protein